MLHPFVKVKPQTRDSGLYPWFCMFLSFQVPCAGERCRSRNSPANGGGNEGKVTVRRAPPSSAASPRGDRAGTAGPALPPGPPSSSRARPPRGVSRSAVGGREPGPPARRRGFAVGGASEPRRRAGVNVRHGPVGPLSLAGQGCGEERPSRFFPCLVINGIKCKPLCV